MRINSSNIGMESARSYHASNTSIRRFSITEYRQESLASAGNGLNAAVTDSQNGKSQTLNDGKKQGQTEEASGKRLYTVEDWRNNLSISVGKINLRDRRSENRIDDFRQATVRYIFDLLFSHRRNRLRNRFEEGDSGSSGSANGTTSENDTNINNDTSVNNGAEANVGPQGFMGLFAAKVRVLNYSQESIHYEQEDTSFSTTGTVRTADGREINFNVNVGMSRQFQQVFKEELQMGTFTMCDPLVINLDTDVAELSDQSFFFDIDADGELDEISQLDGRSGYLALDQNGDGVINDGSELFGTASGDGFADLAKYDEDGNGWIDENDAIWSKLKIWCKDADGRDVLYRLADKGVGAICLQRAATDFTLQGAQGHTNGAIRSTGVFLYENGNVGTVQHVDVAKYEQGA